MNNKDRRGWISDAESEDENEEGDYTVYECPGLAPVSFLPVKFPTLVTGGEGGPRINGYLL